MGNRAVVTFSKNPKSQCVYLHWNGGRASVEGFLGAVRELGLPRTVQSLHAVAFAFFNNELPTGEGGPTAYIETYGQADTDNWDNGVYLINGDLDIIGREFVRGAEEVDQEKTEEVKKEAMERYVYALGLANKTLEAAKAVGNIEFITLGDKNG